ncbi:MAG TPA: hypothetical protein VIL92_06180 [Gaiellaceae bacterium]|jgi:thiamine monophosphate kinase
MPTEKPEDPSAGDDAAPVEEQNPGDVATAQVETGAKKRPTYAADNAVAVNAADLAELVEHARNTGGEAIAARFQL